MGIGVSTYGEFQPASDVSWRLILDPTGAPMVLFEGNGRGLSELITERVGPLRGLPEDTSEQLRDFLEQRWEGDFEDVWFTWLSLSDLEALAGCSDELAWATAIPSESVPEAVGPGFQAYQAESAPLSELLAPILDPALEALRRLGAPRSRLILEFS